MVHLSFGVLVFFFPSLRSFYRLRDKSLKFRRETADTNSVLDFSMRKTSNTCNIYAHKNESKFPSLRTQSHIFFFFIFLCFCFHAETIVGQIILCYVYQFFFIYYAKLFRLAQPKAHWYTTRKLNELKFN